MFKSAKKSYDLIRQRLGLSIDRHIGKSVRRYTKVELREISLDKAKAEEFAARVFFQLPEKIKKQFSAETKAEFIADISTRVCKAAVDKATKKKILGE